MVNSGVNISSSEPLIVEQLKGNLSLQEKAGAKVASILGQSAEYIKNSDTFILKKIHSVLTSFLNQRNELIRDINSIVDFKAKVTNLSRDSNDAAVVSIDDYFEIHQILNKKINDSVFTKIFIPVAKNRLKVEKESLGGRDSNGIRDLISFNKTSKEFMRKLIEFDFEKDGFDQVIQYEESTYQPQYRQIEKSSISNPLFYDLKLKLEKNNEAIEQLKKNLREKIKEITGRDWERGVTSVQSLLKNEELKESLDADGVLKLSNGETFSMPHQLNRDLIGFKYYLQNRDLQQSAFEDLKASGNIKESDKTLLLIDDPQVRLNEGWILEKKFGHQSFLNLATIIHQGILSDLQKHVNTSHTSQGISRTAEDYIPEYFIQDEGDKVRLSMKIYFEVTSLPENELIDTLDTEVPLVFIGAKREIVISKDDLAKDWSDTPAIKTAPSLVVKDSYSNFYDDLQSAVNEMKAMENSKFLQHEFGCSPETADKLLNEDKNTRISKLIDHMIAIKANIEQLPNPISMKHNNFPRSHLDESKASLRSKLNEKIQRENKRLENLKFQKKKLNNSPVGKQLKIKITNKENAILNQINILKDRFNLLDVEEKRSSLATELDLFRQQLESEISKIK